MHGSLAEWFMAPVLKTGVGENQPWVQIPQLPPTYSPDSSLPMYLSGAAKGWIVPGFFLCRCYMPDCCLNPECTFADKPIVMSGVLPHVPVAWCELLAKGYVDSITIPVALDHQALTLTLSGELAGFITYSRYVTSGYLWVHLSYVLPSFRRRGIYRQMFEHLVAREKAVGELKQICSGIHVSNVSAIGAAVAAGRKNDFALYQYDL